MKLNEGAVARIWRWGLPILLGVVAALLTMLVVFQVRHWRLDEQQLHEIVTLIQQGKIQIAQPPPVAPPRKE